MRPESECVHKRLRASENDEEWPRLRTTLCLGVVIIRPSPVHTGTSKLEIDQHGEQE